MKKIITILLLSVSTFGFSQTTNEPRDPLNQQEYAAELESPKGEIAISVYKTATIMEKTLILKTEVKNCKDTKGIILKLSNGETLKFKKAYVSCDSASNGNSAITGRILKGSIPLTPDLYNKLSQLEITEFKLGKTKVPVVYKDKNENLKGLFKFSEQY